MIFYKKCVLIAFVLFKTALEVQGKSCGDLAPDVLKDHGKGELKICGKEKAIVGKQLLATPAPAMLDSPGDSDKNSRKISKNFKTSKIPSTSKSKRFRNPAAKTKRTEVFKMTKDVYQETNNKETLKLLLPIGRAVPMQKIHCRQISKTEINNRGEVIENIQHICAPLTPAAANLKALEVMASHLPATTTESPAGTTPKGINCRRVMNSELNEVGEIVDSVTEVCDPAPRTAVATTTTRKPVVVTTPKITTTTPPIILVKVCRPVMDSYLDEQGKIVDSVQIYCKMEPAP